MKLSRLSETFCKINFNLANNYNKSRFWKTLRNMSKGLSGEFKFFCQSTAASSFYSKLQTNDYKFKHVSWFKSWNVFVQKRAVYSPLFFDLWHQKLTDTSMVSKLVTTLFIKMPIELTKFRTCFIGIKTLKFCTHFEHLEQSILVMPVIPIRNVWTVIWLCRRLICYTVIGSPN